MKNMTKWSTLLKFILLFYVYLLTYLTFIPIIHPTETSFIKNNRYFLAWENVDALAMFIKSHAYDLSLTVDEAVSQQIDNDRLVNKDQFVGNCS